ncbi:hypothetical protein EZV62_028046 [Acer yangbiense]|uniref:Protein POLYCHOME n=1 Tax=Acer yangbiense TaxID=1000413 RepID=A0A5C7GPE4_9ROSI|nr:hypothetical protein EZV62_028046 [Acer yangbiense]
MPEARDRLVRPVDLAASFARRRSGALGVYQDEPEASTELVGSPLFRAAAMTPRGRIREAGRGGGFGTPRGGFGRGRRSTFGVPMGRENTPPLGSARRGRSVLPAWYPRTPLRDITAIVRPIEDFFIAMRYRNETFNVRFFCSFGLPSLSLSCTDVDDLVHPVRSDLLVVKIIVRKSDKMSSCIQAIESRRARLGEVEGQQMDRPTFQDQSEVDSSIPQSSDRPEHDVSLMTPHPASSIKHPPSPVGKVSKILLNITNQAGEGSEFLTPQKKLLNSIDKVEKVVMEELNKLKRTPTAKRAEREKRVRTLMSMR